jgi:hypothetical protein
MSYQRVHLVESTFVQDIINAIRYMHISERLLSFYRLLLDTFFEINTQDFQNTLFHQIYDEEVLSYNDPIDSEEIQDFYADTYEFIRDIYQSYNLEEIRQSILQSV